MHTIENTKMHIEEIIGISCWSITCLLKLLLHTNYFERRTILSVQSKQYKQTTINNNHKTNTTSNMDNNRNNKVGGPSSTHDPICKRINALGFEVFH